MPAISRLFFEIGGDKSKLDQSLREAVESAKAAGLEVTRSGQSIITAFNQALNPTKRLGEEVKLLEAAGKSSAEIWRVYGDRMSDAAEAAKRNGQAVDPLISKHLELNKTVEGSRFSFENLGRSIQDFARDPVGSAKAGVSSLLGSLGPTAIAIGAIGTAAAFAGKALFDMGAEAADQAENLNNLATTTGLSIQQLQALEQIGKEAGLEGLNLSKTLGMLNQQLGSKEGGDFVRAMVNADIALQKTDGSAKDVVELLDELRSNLLKIEDPAKRAQEAHAALGGRMRDLIPLLLNSNTSLADQIKVMKETGPVWDDITQQKLLKFDEALDRIGRAWSSVVTDIKAGVGSILGSLSELGNAEKIDFSQLSPEERVRMEMALDKNLSGLSFPPARFKVDISSLEEAPKITRELFNEQQKLIARNEQDLDLKMKRIEAQKEFDRLLERGTREEVERQAKVLAGINQEIESRKLAAKGEQLYYEILADRAKVATASSRNLAEEYKRDWEEIRRGFEETKRQRLAEDPIPVLRDKSLDDLFDIEKVHGSFEKMRSEQKKSYEQMTGEVQKGAGEIFDAIASRGKGAFSDLGDWIEGVFLSRLRMLFQNLIVSIMTGFRQGLSGLLQNVIPGVGGSGLSFSNFGSSAAGLLGSLGMTGLMVPGNAAIKTAAGMGSALFGGAGMISAGLVPGIGGSFGASLSYLSSGAGLFGSGGLFGLGAATMPVIGAAIAAGAYGIPKLIGAIRGKSSEEAGAMEVTRDLGIGYSKEAFAQFYQSLGLTESSSYGIRHDLIMSPKFLVEQALPIAEATGKLDELLTKLGKAGFREAFELGKATGDWSELNRQFKEAFQNSTNLWKNLPDWQNELMASAAHVKTEIENLTDSLAAMRDALLSSVAPVQTIYDKFMATGEITADFAAQIEKAGGSIERFKEFANLNLQIAGLQQSLSFIESLASSLKGLAPELDPIRQILSGTIGPEAIAALTSAGLDPARFSGLSSLIGMEKSFGSFKPFQALTPELRQALGQYGGEEGRLAIERYGQGFNTITEDLLASTKAAMDKAYQDSIKDALSYLGEAQKETADKMEALINAVDDVKMSIVGVLNKILVSLSRESGDAMTQYEEQYRKWSAESEARRALGRWGNYEEWLKNNPEPKPPSLDTGGVVEKTGWAIVHAGEEYSGVGRSLRQPATINFYNATINRWDDFVQMVHRANIELKMVGA